MTQLPPTYRRFADLNPSVSSAYESLGEARPSGPAGSQGAGTDQTGARRGRATRSRCALSRPSRARRGRDGI